jgi:CheY-like chemotaxis protein
VGRCPINADRSLEGIQVLLIDDNEDTRYIVQYFLEHHGAIVIGAADAREALKSLGEVQTHVIISDLSMPGMDGVSFIEHVRKMPGQGERPTPAIAFTAFPDTQHRRRALAAGFNLYLVKPVDPDVVVREVSRLVRTCREARGVEGPRRKQEQKS